MGLNWKYIADCIIAFAFGGLVFTILMYFSLQSLELCEIECKESPPILEEALERVKNITNSVRLHFDNETKRKIKSLEPNNDSDILYKSGYVSGFAVSRLVCKAENLFDEEW